MQLGFRIFFHWHCIVDGGQTNTGAQLLRTPFYYVALSYTVGLCSVNDQCDLSARF